MTFTVFDMNTSAGASNPALGEASRCCRSGNRRRCGTRVRGKSPSFWTRSGRGERDPSWRKGGGGPGRFPADSPAPRGCGSSSSQAKTSSRAATNGGSSWTVRRFQPLTSHCGSDINGYSASNLLNYSCLWRRRPIRRQLSPALLGCTLEASRI